jgi:hypothetical protein
MATAAAQCRDFAVLLALVALLAWTLNDVRVAYTLTDATHTAVAHLECPRASNGTCRVASATSPFGYVLLPRLETAAGAPVPCGGGACALLLDVPACATSARADDEPRLSMWVWDDSEAAHANWVRARSRGPCLSELPHGGWLFVVGYGCLLLCVAIPAESTCRQRRLDAAAAAARAVAAWRRDFVRSQRVATALPFAATAAAA